MFKQIRVVDNFGEEELYLVRNTIPGCVHSSMKRFMDNSKMYFHVMSDGIVVAGHYNSKGDWKRSTPVELNDVFELKNENAVWDGRVFVDGEEALILASKVEELQEKYSIHEKFQELINSEQKECVIAIEEC